MDDLTQLAELIKTRNRIAEEITAVIGRPALIGHVGEYIASRIFAIDLEESASQKSIDGHFTTGLLKGRSVNIKWYGKREGLLDITPDALPDFYLVLTGAKASAMSSRGKTRPWLIKSVFLFDAPELCEALRKRGIKMGVETSVRQQHWQAAEVYPGHNARLPLSDGQRRFLALFG